MSKQTPVAFLARLVAKPGQEDAVAAFLASALPLAQAEPSTTVWFAVRINQREFGIFDAFPDEAAKAKAMNDMTLLVNDDTELRAQATFLRTMVTRDTPFDKFLAGDDSAMTKAQLRGAKLFFMKADVGGAGCFGCHSGPMLNKQPNDPDVAGIGQLVEENFINVGIGDHPVQALNAIANGNRNAGQPNSRKSALDSHVHKAAMDVDDKAGTDIGISGTPAFIINGYYVSGAQPYGKFKKLIDRALAEAK